MDWTLIEVRRPFDMPHTEPTKVWEVGRNGLKFQVDADLVSAEGGGTSKSRLAYLESQWMGFLMLHAEADDREWMAEH